MDNEENKRISRSVSFTQLEQVHSDFALALALQDQERERAVRILTAIESDSDEDESSASNDNIDAGFFGSLGFEAELESLEGEDSNNDDQEMEEDDIDPDELSYEELILLGEIVGEESRGLSADVISKSLHPYTFQTVECKTGIDRCVICQVEYEGGEMLVALPCEHPYHSECISNWLQIKKICPICSTEVSSP